MSTKERIEALPRRGLSGHMLLRSDVMAAIDEPWQDKPEPGEWWVSIHPDARKLSNSDTFVRPVRVLTDGSVTMHGFMFAADHEFLRGAKWQKRTTPADPFAKEKVQP